MLFDLFKKKPKETKVYFPKTEYTYDAKYLSFELYDWQYPFAESECIKVLNSLKQNEYTKELPLQFRDLESGGFAFNPFTPKGKIKLKPCNMNLRFRTAKGIPYMLSIAYDVNDAPKTASYSIAYVFPDGDSYTVDLHYVNNRFYVTKVVKTDSHYNNTKLYHIRKEDINDN